MAQMGRPRQFDRDAALVSAMHLFWEHGYESTSLSQLKTRLGISAPSFYAAFTSKEALFHEAVALYLNTHGQVTACLWDKQLAARDALELALRRSARMQSEQKHPKGCMVTLGVMSACTPENAGLTRALTASRARTREGIYACVKRGVESQQLAADTNIDALATLFYSFLSGLSTLARDGATYKEMDAAVSQVLKLWDAAAT